jgi:hypothetical protein
MKKLLLIGAGKSSGYLIDYLLNYAVAENYELTVADLSEEAAYLKTQGRPNSKAISLDINNKNAWSQKYHANIILNKNLKRQVKADRGSGYCNFNVARIHAFSCCQSMC